MKKNSLFKAIVFSFLCLNAFAQSETKTKKVFGIPVKAENISSNGHVRCFSSEYEEYLQSINSKRLTDVQFEAWLAPLVEQYKATQILSSESGGIITIPVVVHVIHNGEAYGTGPNITDEQVESQITVMNQDFRKIIGTPGYNTNTVGVDTQIQFALAKVDPNGNPTNGINRVNLCQASWSTGNVDGVVKPATSWDPSQYMNMWSVNFSDASLLGYAQFPDASGLLGLNTSGGAANTDGVVAGYKFFGSSAITTGEFQAPFDRGRTMTHEVGHWIGLRHIWGDGGCSVDDFCADTPVAGSPNFGCVEGTNTCSIQPGLDMIENYMDYTDDTCMNIFTQNQKDRMVVIMNNAQRRVSLKTSTKDLPIALFANDAEIKVEKNCNASSSSGCSTGGSGSINQRVSLYNRGTSNLTSATISYNINGSGVQTFNWTGNLATNKFIYIDLPVSNPVTGTFNASITAANGTDQRASNNTSSESFSAPTGPANFSFNNVLYTLVGDRYGAETTWELKNSAGTILYSGGPYTNLSSNTTQNLVTNQSWSLASNDCYTFTINDSYGDGICCAYGAGYYNIKSTDGTVTLVSGTGSFGTGENKFFSINFLSTDSFELAEQIFIYPNPAKDVLNISIPSGFELPKNIEVHNNLGQTVMTKIISNSSDLILNTSSLSNGVYFITIEKNAIKKTLKFIKE